MAAFLRQIGGREIDGDPTRGQREAGGDQRRADPLAGFRDRLVGETDDMKGVSSMPKKLGPMCRTGP